MALVTEVEEIPIEEQGPLFSINASIVTTPTRGRLYVDGNYIGRTPFTGVISSDNEQATLTVRKTDFETTRFSISMLEGDLAQQVDLRPSNPFGRTGTMGGRRSRP